MDGRAVSDSSLVLLRVCLLSAFASFSGSTCFWTGRSQASRLSVGVSHRLYSCCHAPSQRSLNASNSQRP